MTGYLMSFTFYTLAMIGVILLGYVIAKKSLNGVYTPASKNKFLSIESSLVLEPRKNIYVLKAGNERFLVSTNAEQTSYLTKLDSENVPSQENYEAENKTISLSPALTRFNAKIIAEKLNSLLSIQGSRR